MLLWALERSPVLSATTRESIENPDNEVFVSAASIWEVGIKRTKGKLRTVRDLSPFVNRSGFARLAITFEHASAAAELPRHHADPFDRMLVAQARIEGLTLVTADPKISLYDVPIFPVTRS